MECKHLFLSVPVHFLESPFSQMDVRAYRFRLPATSFEFQGTYFGLLASFFGCRPFLLDRWHPFLDVGQFFWTVDTNFSIPSVQEKDPDIHIVRRLSVFLIQFCYSNILFTSSAFYFPSLSQSQHYYLLSMPVKMCFRTIAGWCETACRRRITALSRHSGPTSNSLVDCRHLKLIRNRT